MFISHNTWQQDNNADSQPNTYFNQAVEAIVMYRYNTHEKCARRTKAVRDTPVHWSFPSKYRKKGMFISGKSPLDTIRLFFLVLLECLHIKTGHYFANYFVHFYIPTHLVYDSQFESCIANDLFA